MAITGVSLAEKVDYILSRDPSKDTDPQNATVFILGALDAYSRAELSDSIVRMFQTEKGMELVPNRNYTALRAARLGLIGWRNLKDENGNDIKFESNNEYRNGKSYTVASELSLARLDPEDVKEIGEEIMRLNSISADMAGK